MPRKSQKTIEKEIREEVKQELLNKIEKRKKFWSAIGNFFNDFGMYAITVGGVILSKYIPEFREGNDIIIELPKWGNIAIAGVIALIVSAGHEYGGDKVGKRRNWAKRALFHLANGVMWQTFIGG
jgi:hypothetical protein